MKLRSLVTLAAMLGALLIVPGLAHAGIDPPTISASVAPSPNGDGWNNTSPVTVTFTCADDDTVVSCTSPVDVTTEGAAQLVEGTVEDNDGNIVTTSVEVSLDLTAPSISGAALSAPNGSSWYSAPVTIEWTCDDALSGVASCPADSSLTGEGADQSATATATDVAGNTADGTVSDIDIDLTAPATVASVTGSSGTVTADLTASDNLSGVVDTLYSLDGAPKISGTSVSVIGEGTHTLSFHSVDAADNVEDTVTIEMLVDDTAPSITHAIDPAPNGDGWNNSDTSVTFTCDDALSGLASCTGDATLTADGAGQAVEGTATDNAGNVATDTAVVNLDATDPTIDADALAAANGAGWHNAPVDVSFTCNDATSGITTCLGATTLGEGADQSVTGDAADLAGNTASATVSDIDIDLTAPSISGAIVETPNGAGWFDGPVTVQWTCSDDLSGIDACPGDSIVSTDGAGQSVSAIVADLAGNETVGEVTGINIDSDGPVISATRNVQPNANGWNRTDVTVTWTCTDDGEFTLSESSFTFSTEGANLSHTATCTDVAGNAATDTQTAKIDKTSPLTTIAQYVGGDLRGGATDNLSGVESVRTSWTVIASFERDAVCAQGCGTTSASWRITPPNPRPNVYRVAAWSIDLAGNTGPSDTDTIIALP